MGTIVRVDRLEEALLRLASAQEQTEAQVGVLTAAQARAETRLGELSSTVQGLAAAQVATEARLGELAAAQVATEARLGELSGTMQRLADAQVRTETQLGALLSWQRGEDGRRRGEQLEREVRRGGPTLFVGGSGGSPERRFVQRFLRRALADHLQDQVHPGDDPFLADVLWWKGDQIALVEVSSVVDDHDVERAQQRAWTLQRAGAQAIPMVIGNSWADGEVRALADAYKMGWKVGDDVSEAYIAFRRLPDRELDAEAG